MYDGVSVTMLAERVSIKMCTWAESVGAGILEKRKTSVQLWYYLPTVFGSDLNTFRISKMFSELLVMPM